MEFKRKNVFSYYENLSLPSLVDKSDIKEMVCNEYLLEKRYHYIIEKQESYLPILMERSLPEVITHIEEAYLKGNSIIIKGLEFWNDKIQSRCKQLQGNPDVHLYLSPPAGTCFDWHADDRDVFIFMQKGEKLFEVEEPDLTISRYLLTEGSKLFIPYGAKHRAITSNMLAIHLSFGIWPEGIEIKKHYSELSTPFSIPL